MPDYKMRPDKLDVRVNSPLAKTWMIRAGTKCTVNAVVLSWNIAKICSFVCRFIDQFYLTNRLNIYIQLVNIINVGNVFNQ